MSAKLAPWEILGVEKHELPLLLPASYQDLSLVVDDFSQLLNQFIGKMVVVQGHCVHQGMGEWPKAALLRSAVRRQREQPLPSRCSAPPPSTEWPQIPTRRRCVFR